MKAVCKEKGEGVGVGVGVGVGCQHRMLHVPIQKSLTHPKLLRLLKHTVRLLPEF